MKSAQTTTRSYCSSANSYSSWALDPGQVTSPLNLTFPICEMETITIL